jgi:hypothetical protein
MGNPKIFINYRRDDSEQYVFGLGLLLNQQYPDQVFWDRDTIQPGRKFKSEIEKSLNDCAVFVAVIGERWLTIENDRGERRLFHPEDVLRLELRAALEREIPVIPLLVGEAQMPSRSALPEDIRTLAEWNAMRIHLDQARSSVAKLISVIDSLLAEAATKAAPAQAPMPVATPEFTPPPTPPESAKAEPAPAPKPPPTPDPAPSPTSPPLAASSLQPAPPAKPALNMRRPQLLVGAGVLAVSGLVLAGVYFTVEKFQHKSPSRTTSTSSTFGSQLSVAPPAQSSSSSSTGSSLPAGSSGSSAAPATGRSKPAVDPDFQEFFDLAQKNNQTKHTATGIDANSSSAPAASTVHPAQPATTPSKTAASTDAFRDELDSYFRNQGTKKTSSNSSSTSSPTSGLVSHPAQVTTTPSKAADGTDTFQRELEEAFKNAPAKTSSSNSSNTSKSSGSPPAKPDVVAGQKQILPDWIVNVNNDNGLRWASRDFSQLPSVPFQANHALIRLHYVQDALLWAYNNAKYGGYSDWRIPTQTEMATLCGTDQKRNAYKSTFPASSSFLYWTSTMNYRLVVIMNCKTGQVGSDSIDDDMGYPSKPQTVPTLRPVRGHLQP